MGIDQPKDNSGKFTTIPAEGTPEHQTEVQKQQKQKLIDDMNQRTKNETYHRRRVWGNAGVPTVDNLPPVRRI